VRGAWEDGGDAGAGGSVLSAYRPGGDVQNTNIFAALEGTKRKKTIKKRSTCTRRGAREGTPRQGQGERGGGGAGRGQGRGGRGGGGAEKQPGGSPVTPVTVSSWADCEDDDEEYFATTVPVFPGMEAGGGAGGSGGGRGGGRRKGGCRGGG